VAALDVQHPNLGELLREKKVVVSVNQEIAHWETALGESDEIALLPPFAGGA
jgi:molybdopterin converting factor small subunit